MIREIKEDADGLKTIVLNLYHQGNERGCKCVVSLFIDENGKLSRAMYRLVGALGGTNRIFKLDKRSIRYMKRVQVFNNGNPLEV